MSEKQDMHEEVLKAGKESLDLIQRFLAGRMSGENFMAGLAGLAAGEIMSRHWAELTADPKNVPYWQVLQTLQGLVDELEFQLAEYGESTLYEDMKEIAVNLNRIVEQAGSKYRKSSVKGLV